MPLSSPVLPIVGVLTCKQQASNRSHSPKSGNPRALKLVCGYFCDFEAFLPVCLIWVDFVSSMGSSELETGIEVYFKSMVIKAIEADKITQGECEGNHT